MSALPRHNRLKRRRQIDRLFERTNKNDAVVSFARGTFRTIYSPVLSIDGHAKVGIFVSKRAGNAVARNRIKRMCRTIAHRRIADVESSEQGKATGVVFLYRGSADIPDQRIREDMEYAVNELINRLSKATR